MTLGYWLEDSPAGVPAWNAALWSGFGEYAQHVGVPRAGHLAYVTDPDLVVGDLRQFFESL